MRCVLLAALAALAGCKAVNSKYCGAHPEDIEVCGYTDAAPDMSTACESNVDCPGEVCKLTAEPAACVECYAGDTSLCIGTTPICDTDDQCRGCRGAADCPTSDVCLPDGSCADSANVIYAATNGSGLAACGDKAMPCNLTQALTNAMAPRNIVKLVVGTNDFTVSGSTGISISNNRIITIAAEGATIRKTSSGQLVTVGATGNVTLIGGTWTAASFGDVISCANGGVLAIHGADIGGGTSGISDAGCGMTIERTTIHDNTLTGIYKTAGSLTLSRSRVQTNGGGGVYLSGTAIQFRIVGNVLWANGVNYGSAGGVYIVTNTGPTSRLDFNTLSANRAGAPAGNAIHCDVGGFTARNNVMFGNDSAGNMEQVSSTCTHTHSIASPGTLPSGMGNSAMDPQFIDALTGNFHTQVGSPTEGAADPASDLTGIAMFDIDGEPRTSPADQGADEHP